MTTRIKAGHYTWYETRYKSWYSFGFVLVDYQTGPSCSKLRKSLVNDSLKFTSSDTQICWNFLLKKMWVAFAVQKLLTFFQQKYQNIVYWIR